MEYPILGRLPLLNAPVGCIHNDNGVNIDRARVYGCTQKKNGGAPILNLLYMTLEDWGVHGKGKVRYQSMHLWDSPHAVLFFIVAWVTTTLMELPLQLLRANMKTTVLRSRRPSNRHRRATMTFPTYVFFVTDSLPLPLSPYRRHDGLTFFKITPLEPLSLQIP